MIRPSQLFRSLPLALALFAGLWASGCGEAKKSSPPTTPSPPAAAPTPEEARPPSPDADPPGWTTAFALRDAAGKPLARVTMAALDSADRLYVLEDDGEERKALHLFAPDGAHLRTWDALTYGSNTYDFFFPTSLDVDPAGNLFLCDSGFYWVNKFDREGKFVKTIAGRAVPESGILTPGRAATDASGNIYVTEGEKTTVHVFTPEGRTLAVVDTKRADLPGHRGIAAVAVGADGRRHVVSTGGLMLTFNAEWGFLRSVMAPDCRLVDTGRNGLVVVANSGTILLYDGEGREVSKWVASEDAPEFGAAGIALDSHDRLVVVDQRMEMSPPRFTPPRVLRPR